MLYWRHNSKVRITIICTTKHTQISYIQYVNNTGHTKNSSRKIPWCKFGLRKCTFFSLENIFLISMNMIFEIYFQNHLAKMRIQIVLYFRRTLAKNFTFSYSFRFQKVLCTGVDSQILRGHEHSCDRVPVRVGHPATPGQRAVSGGLWRTNIRPRIEPLGRPPRFFSKILATGF